MIGPKASRRNWFARFGIPCPALWMKRLSIRKSRRPWRAGLKKVSYLKSGLDKEHARLSPHHLNRDSYVVSDTQSLQIRRIESLQIVGDEEAVFADEFAVEPDFSPAPFLALDEDHVPMHGAAV